MRRVVSSCVVLALLSAGAGAAPGVAASSAGSGALHVVSVSPHWRSTVAGDTAFTLRFSSDLAPGQTVRPRLIPSLAGRWSQTGSRTLRFTPAGAYSPGTPIRLIVPAGIRAADGAVLRRKASFKYLVGQPSPARLVELLADLRYLPVHFVSRHDPRWVDSAGQLRALYSPPSGHFVFGSGWPGFLHSLWWGDNSLVVRGAVMAFQSQHGLAMDGSAGPQVWSALLAAIHRQQANRAGYTYAIGSEASPETLTVYHNGGVAVHTLANTGIPAAPTARGTFPVYQRLRSQVMKGTNPDGSHYADYVQWVAYFHGGEAVHYIPRSSWGYPQSLGCIEVPFAAAERAWGYLGYGTLVTVTG